MNNAAQTMEYDSVDIVMRAYTMNSGQDMFLSSEYGAADDETHCVLTLEDMAPIDDAMTTREYWEKISQNQKFRVLQRGGESSLVIIPISAWHVSQSIRKGKLHANRLEVNALIDLMSAALVVGRSYVLVAF